MDGIVGVIAPKLINYAYISCAYGKILYSFFRSLDDPSTRSFIIATQRHHTLGVKYENNTKLIKTKCDVL